MYWADELAAAVTGPQVVNDSKTPSGTVHVGSLRGVVLHDAIRRALIDVGTPVVFRYGVEDLDPMDAQALLTPDAVARYMGVPLANVPAPEGSGAPNYARHFVGPLPGHVRGPGHHARAVLDERALRRGEMDPYIVRALDQAATIREIYRTVSTVDHPDRWLPISVICEDCGRSGTTIASGWDGREVTYDCRADLVDGPSAAAFMGARRRSAGAPSSSGTSTGPRAGGSSGRPSRVAARISPRRAARATGPMPSAAASSTGSRRSTCPTSS